MKIDTLIFDLDNTIVNTSQLKSYRDQRNWEECKNLISTHTELIIDPNELPSDLKIGIVTNSPRGYAEKILEFYNFPYDCLVAYQDCKPRKPDKAPMIKCLEQLNSTHLNSLCIGDNRIDMEAGNSARIFTVGVTWGDCDESQLKSSNADQIVDDIAILYDIIEKLTTSEYEPLFVNQNDYKKSFYYIDKYYPYGSTDKEFFKASNSGLILDLKQEKINGIEYYFKKLDAHLRGNITICIVPSSDSEKQTSGMQKIAEKLVVNNRIDAIHCLKRNKSIEKLAHGGNRDIQTHLDSIEVIDDHLIKGKDIILLDDICTTKNSFMACVKLLIQAGANRVVCVALGKTTYQALKTL